MFLLKTQPSPRSTSTHNNSNSNLPSTHSRCLLHNNWHSTANHNNLHSTHRLNNGLHSTPNNNSLHSTLNSNNNLHSTPRLNNNLHSTQWLNSNWPSTHKSPSRLAQEHLPLDALTTRERLCHAFLKMSFQYVPKKKCNQYKKMKTLRKKIQKNCHLSKWS